MSTPESSTLEGIFEDKTMMNTMSAGEDIQVANGRWSFDGQVSKVFDKHVSKSVPLYEEGHDLIVQLSDFFIRDNSVIYEIGCSTGMLISKLAEAHKDKNVKFIGIDVVPDMVERAKERCSKYTNVEILLADALDFEFQKCDMIISYYTLQFIQPKYRQIVTDKFYEALNWGGSYMLFEKMRGPDARFQDIFTQLYHEFKLTNGYTPSDIMGKMRSLKGILEPFSELANYDILKRAGFEDYTSIMRYLCFSGVLSIK